MLFEDRNPCPWLDRWLDKHDTVAQRAWWVIGWVVGVVWTVAIVAGVVFLLAFKGP